MNMAVPAAAEQCFRLHDKVARVNRDHSVVLVSRINGTSVRVSPGAVDLLPLLAEGASSAILTERLRALHPGARNLAIKLQSFLAQLAHAGLLEAAEAPREKKSTVPTLILGQPDRAAHALAKAVLFFPRVLRLLALNVLLLGAVGGIAALTLQLGAHPLPPLQTFFSAFSWQGLALFILLIVPLHEFSHAVACRMAGVAVGSAGIYFHGYIMPGPFIQTGFFYQIREKHKRFWVPAAGPLINLLGAGSAAWLLVLVDGPLGQALQPTLATLFILCAAFIYLDTNPLTPSDGSRMLEALLDDELARRSALSRKRAGLSFWKAVWLYRLAIALHLSASAAIIYLWWVEAGL